VGIDRARFVSVRERTSATLATGHVPPAAVTFVESSAVVPEQTSSGTVDDRAGP
jgi:hypothetical protein